MKKNSIGPTGKLIRGHVLDVNKTSLEQALRRYEPRLYLHWNPLKRGGWGCYELRLRPEKKYAVPYGPFMGGQLYVAEYHEIEGEAHVRDVDVLSYDLVKWVSEADTWKYFGGADEHKKRMQQILLFEKREAERKQAEQDKAREDLMYNMMQHKTMIRQYKDLILSGVNPAAIASAWDQKKTR